MDDLAHATIYDQSTVDLVSLRQRLSLSQIFEIETEMAIRLLRKRKHRFRKKQMVRSIS